MATHKQQPTQRKQTRGESKGAGQGATGALATQLKQADYATGRGMVSPNKAVQKKEAATQAPTAPAAAPATAASEAATQPGITTGIIDRIEGGFAVIEDDKTFEMVDVPLSKLPAWAREGDRFDGEVVGPAKMPSGVIDRIEGAYAVVEDAVTLAMVDVPVAWLPADVREGQSI
jgi:hypothetical protein